MVLIGVLYKNNEIGYDDAEKKAMYWFEKAAQLGYAPAQYELGYQFACGNLVEQDYTKSLYWYQKAADQNYASAQYNLGAMYYNGEGVQKDPEKATRWFEAAASGGNASAKAVLKQIKG